MTGGLTPPLFEGDTSQRLFPLQPRPLSTLADQAATTIPLWPDDNLPLERWCTCQEATQRRSELAGGQVAMAVGLGEPQ
jgi:hypothetical protein